MVRLNQSLPPPLLLLLPSARPPAETHLFAVFDGHGELGTECAQFANDKVSTQSINSTHCFCSMLRATSC